MQIAIKIREARKRSGLSQRELAAKLKISHSAIAQWETDVTLPTIGNRADLSRLLNIPFTEMLPEAGKVGELTITDPLILAIVQQLQRLPPPLQEAFLMQAAATAEALSRGADPKKPA
jgi:transcriptional regulator with XRE-family HTH domain